MLAKGVSTLSDRQPLHCGGRASRVKFAGDASAVFTLFCNG